MKATEIFGSLKLDHLAFACNNFENSKFLNFTKILGFKKVHEEVVSGENTEVLLLKPKHDDILLELITPSTPDSSLAKFLSSKGEGFHHICYKTTHLRSTLDELKSIGIHPIEGYPKVGSKGKLICFLNPKDTGGILVELAEDPK